VLKAGEEKEFKIISIEPGEHRLGLSLKALTEKPKTETEDKPEKVTEEAAKAN
jgi:ribosomal protein S1